MRERKRQCGGFPAFGTDFAISTESALLLLARPMYRLATRNPADYMIKSATAPSTAARVDEVSASYRTANGTMLVGRIEDALRVAPLTRQKGKINLIFTSPPFPLTRKKRYGNKTGDEYLTWLRELAPRLVEMLAPDGSIVVEVGNAWEPGAPVMSTLPLRALLAFQEAADLHLCQQVICHNPARLPVRRSGSPSSASGSRTRTRTSGGCRRSSDRRRATARYSRRTAAT